jgi:hypothetical protein
MPAYPVGQRMKSWSQSVLQRSKFTLEDALSMVNVVWPKSLLAKFIFHFPTYGKSVFSTL